MLAVISVGVKKLFVLDLSSLITASLSTKNYRRISRRAVKISAMENRNTWENMLPVERLPTGFIKKRNKITSATPGSGRSGTHFNKRGGILNKKRRERARI